MTTFANLVLADGLATPVNHTFSMKKIGDGNDSNSILAVWEDRVTGTAVGFSKISQMLRFPGTTKGASRSTKVTVKVNVPVMEVVTNSTTSGIAPAPTVAYQVLATLEVVLPERSSAASRADIYAYLKNYVLTNEFKNAVLFLDPVL